MSLLLFYWRFFLLFFAVWWSIFGAFHFACTHRLNHQIFAYSDRCTFFWLRILHSASRFPTLNFSFYSSISLIDCHISILFLLSTYLLLIQSSLQRMYRHEINLVSSHGYIRSILTKKHFYTRIFEILLDQKMKENNFEKAAINRINWGYVKFIKNCQTIWKRFVWII